MTDRHRVPERDTTFSSDELGRERIRRIREPTRCEQEILGSHPNIKGKQTGILDLTADRNERVDPQLGPPVDDHTVQFAEQHIRHRLPTHVQRDPLKHGSAVGRYNPNQVRHDIKSVEPEPPCPSDDVAECHVRNQLE